MFPKKQLTTGESNKRLPPLDRSITLGCSEDGFCYVAERRKGILFVFSFVATIKPLRPRWRKSEAFDD